MWVTDSHNGFLSFKDAIVLHLAFLSLSACVCLCVNSISYKKSGNGYHT